MIGLLQVCLNSLLLYTAFNMFKKAILKYIFILSLIIIKASSAFWNLRKHIFTSQDEEKPIELK